MPYFPLMTLLLAAAVVVVKRKEEAAERGTEGVPPFQQVLPPLHGVFFGPLLSAFAIFFTVTLEHSSNLWHQGIVRIWIA